MLSTPSGIAKEKCSKNENWENHFGSATTCCKLGHPLKAFAPILVMLRGIVTDTRPEPPENMFASMLVIPYGIVKAI